MIVLFIELSMRELELNKQVEFLLIFVKTRIDLSILLSLLLSKEQLVLYQCQHARAFASQDKSDERDNPAETYDELIKPDLLLQPRQEIKVAFDKIRGYEVRSDLDRRLIFGIWKHQDRKLSSVEDILPEVATQISGQ